MATSNFSPESWLAVGNRPATLTFDEPDADDNIVFYAWFTNQLGATTLHRSMGSIIYTRAAPRIDVHATTRPLRVMQTPCRIEPLVACSSGDGGVCGGTIAGEEIGIRDVKLLVISGPDSDATPDKRYATLAEAGVYSVKVVAQNIAGNVITSATTTITLDIAADEPALTFNGTSSRIDAGAGHFANLKDLTLSAWIKMPKKPADGAYALIAGHGYYQTDHGFGIYLNSSGNLVFQPCNESIRVPVTTPYPFDSHWHHVVGLRDGDESRLYLDGELVATASGKLGTFISMKNFGIGAHYSSEWKNFFKGAIAEVQLWDRARSTEEIRASMHQRATGLEEGLIGYWPLNEGVGTTAYHQQLAAHHGAISGASWQASDTLRFSSADLTLRENFSLMNLLTGSSRLTSSNEVGIANIPPIDGITEFQFTHDEDVDALFEENWNSIDQLPATLSFECPESDDTVAFHIWLRDQQQNLYRSSGVIGYTTVPPTTKVRTTITRAFDGVNDVVIEPDEVDIGCSAGTALGMAMGIAARQVRLVSGPAPDAAPESPAAHLTAEGLYQLELIVVNEAGNVATSALCQATIIQGAKPFLRFNGSSAYVDMGAGKLDNQTDFTLAAWVRIKDAPGSGGYYGIAGHGYLGSETRGFGLYANSAKNAFLQPRGTVNQQIVWYSAGGAYPFADEWHHLTGIRRGDTTLYYLDGVLFSVNSGKLPKFSTIRSFALGAIDNGDWRNFLKGDLAEVQLWDYALSAAAVRDLMQRRMRGGDSGLRGYWPLDEGVGDFAYDYATDSATGDIIDAAWLADVALAEAVPFRADFVGTLPTTLRDPITGNTLFTDATTVTTEMPTIPGDYSHFQITAQGDSDVLNGAGWQEVADFPVELTFARPTADTNLAWFVWFTNLNESVTLRRSIADIIYIEVLPSPSASNSYSRLAIPGSPLAIYPAEIDNATHGGIALGEKLPLKSVKLIASGDVDTTPEAEHVTLPGVGTWQVALVAENIMGHVATSAFCQVEVTAWGGETFVWSGTIDNDWHNPRNWDIMGVPCAASSVTMPTGKSITIAAATPRLHSFTQAGGTLTFAGDETILNATTITINGGTITHQPNSATAPDGSGAWPVDGRIWLTGDDITIAAAATINAGQLGYSGGTGTAGYGPGGGKVGAGSNNNFSGGGAGHGGQGGRYQQRGAGGSAYDELKTPTLPGSGGGGRQGLTIAGTTGGGVVRIEAGNTLQIDGKITANSIKSSNNYVGAGSGGAVWLTTRRLGGSGSITANGGNGGTYSGAGSGGRIAIWRASDAPGLALTVTANAGSSGGINEIEPGTIHWKKSKVLS